MANVAKTIDLVEQMKSTTIVIKLKRKSQLRFRIWIASKVIRFGIWVSGAKGKVKLY